MPLIGTRGAASAQGFGEFAQSAAPVYIEDVFSTYLYSGNSSTQTITNGLDISGKGGLVWLKMRSNVQYHYLFDTARGPLYSLSTNATDQSYSIGNTVTAFNSNGFNLGLNSATNGSGDTFVSWTFRKQPKFFDVVTYTGTGVARTITHNLGSVPGCIIVKRTDTTGDWQVYHRGLPSNGFRVLLNSTAAYSFGNYWNYTDPTATEFSVGTNGDINVNGGTYVAYIFAHDAGGFGTAGTDNVISCGTYTGDSTLNWTKAINLGFEAQWVMIKNVSGAGDWVMTDVFRNCSFQTDQTWQLKANTADAESGSGAQIAPYAQGFLLNSNNTNINASGNKYVYVAIRRGQMRTPTTGTSVFEPAFATANSPEYKSNTVISGFDSAITIYRPGYSDANFSFPYTASRLQGARLILQTSRTNAEYAYSAAANFNWMNGWFNSTFGNDTNRESYMFKRATGFHDVVCYTGTGSNTTVPHNLGVVPEMMIVKIRTPNAYNWYVYHSAIGTDKYAELNLTRIPQTSTNVWNNTAPTASVINLGTNAGVNESASTYFAMLFASCPGVSKVGSYSGTGANQTINCGFASGVRWVLIKRTDTTGDWYVYDTTRGMTSGTDPYILLNSVAAEVTGTNYVETIATGFRLIGSNAGTNANGGTYIYLAIA